MKSKNKKKKPFTIKKERCPLGNWSTKIHSTKQNEVKKYRPNLPSKELIENEEGSEEL